MYGESWYGCRDFWSMNISPCQWIVLAFALPIPDSISPLLGRRPNSPDVGATAGPHRSAWPDLDGCRRERGSPLRGGGALTERCCPATMHQVVRPSAQLAPLGPADDQSRNSIPVSLLRGREFRETSLLLANLGLARARSPRLSRGTRVLSMFFCK